jgi:hypothetical protein
MKRDYPVLEELRKEFGMNKVIPQKYEHVILKVLSHYPELRETTIEFRLKASHPVPHSTSVSFGSLLKLQVKYVINLLEKAEPPFEQALFRNLPEGAQPGVIGHELGHVLLYKKMGPLSAFKKALSQPGMREKRSRERAADIIALEHGLGFELYTHAVYIRTIDGYMERRKDLEVCYLHPHEILEALPPDQLHAVNTPH